MNQEYVKIETEKELKQSFFEAFQRARKTPVANHPFVVVAEIFRQRNIPTEWMSDGQLIQDDVKRLLMRLEMNGLPVASTYQPLVGSQFAKLFRPANLPSEGDDGDDQLI